MADAATEKTRLAEARRLERLLLVQDPTRIEHTFPPARELQMAKIIESGRGALKYGNEYVVFNDGVRFTTKDLPPDIPVTEANTPEKPTYFVDRLRDALAQAGGIEHPFANESALRFIESFYADEKEWDRTRYEFECMEAVERSLKQNENLAFDAERLERIPEERRSGFIENWATECYGYLVNEFNQRRITGEAAACGVATVRLLATSGLSEEFVGISHATFAEICDKFTMSNTPQDYVCFDPALYLYSPDTRIADALISGLRVAQNLQDEAEGIIKSAQNQCLSEMFFEGLFSAALRVQSARCMFTALQKTIAQRTGEIDEGLKYLVDECNADAMLCEEYCAHIISSLRMATITREDRQLGYSYNAADAYQFEQWIAELASYEDASKADIELTDAYIRLQIPKILLDLGRAAVKVLRGDYSDRQWKRLDYIASRFEITLPLAVMMIEQNYLRTIYKLLKRLTTERELADESEDYAFRTTDEYFSQRIREVTSQREIQGAVEAMQLDANFAVYEPEVQTSR